MERPKHPQSAKPENSRTVRGGACLPYRADCGAIAVCFTALAKAKSQVPAPKSEGRGESKRYVMGSLRNIKDEGEYCALYSNFCVFSFLNNIVIIFSYIVSACKHIYEAWLSLLQRFI